MNDRQRITVRPRRREQQPRLARSARPARVRITDRDRAVFRALALHRLLTSEQLRRLIFADTDARRVRRRLRLLYDAGLLERVAVVAQPTRGVPPYVYQLTETSAEMSAADLGRPVRLPSSRSRSLRFLGHHVGVCDFFVTLSEALRTTPWTIGEWLHEWQLKVPDAEGVLRAERVQLTDPDTNKERELTLLPDAFFTLVNAATTRYFFFELDLASHPQQRWRDRGLAFSAFSRQGRFADRFTQGRAARFQVLVVTTPDWRGRSRCDNILQTIRSAIGPNNLFLAATTDDIHPFLFSLPVDPETNLDSGRVSNALRQKFAERNRALSPQLRVSVPETGRRWEIQDGSHRYLILRDADALTISIPDRILGPIWRSPGSSARHSLLPNPAVPRIVALPAATRRHSPVTVRSQPPP